ncbi:hypothetical protein GQR58_016763 [Nymphon striatum]|nr:hypothetical protein GQR58_016763 [Nymphon striatum]
MIPTFRLKEPSSVKDINGGLVRWKSRHILCALKNPPASLFICCYSLDERVYICKDIDEIRISMDQKMKVAAPPMKTEVRNFEACSVCMFYFYFTSTRISKFQSSSSAHIGPLLSKGLPSRSPVLSIGSFFHPIPIKLSYIIHPPSLRSTPFSSSPICYPHCGFSGPPIACSTGQVSGPFPLATLVLIAGIKTNTENGQDSRKSIENGVKWAQFVNHWLSRDCGEITEDTHKLLKRLKRNLPPGPQPVKLFALNLDVEMWNSECLLDMEGKLNHLYKTHFVYKQ